MLFTEGSYFFLPTCTELRKEGVEIAELVSKATRDHQIQDYFQKRYKYLESPPLSWGQNLIKKTRRLFSFGRIHQVFIRGNVLF